MGGNTKTDDTSYGSGDIIGVNGTYGVGGYEGKTGTGVSGGGEYGTYGGRADVAAYCGSKTGVCSAKISSSGATVKLVS